MKAGGKSGGDCTLLDGSGGMEAGKRGSGGADGQTVRRSDGQTLLRLLLQCSQRLTDGIGGIAVDVPGTDD